MLRRAVYLLIILVWISNITAQVTKIKINSIAIEGNRTAESSSVRLNSGLMVGDEVTREDLQKAVKNLWSLGLFSDIKILVSNQGIEGIDLLIQVKEYPRLNKVILEGNDELDTDDIEKEILVYRGMKVSPYKTSKIKQTIKKMYIEEGYLLADIQIDTVQVSEGTVNLDITIAEGEEVQVEKITFHGNTALDDDDLRGAMDEIQENTWWRSADFNQEKYDVDLELILSYYREQGYRDAEVIRDSISYSDDNREMFINIWVYEGEKYHFGKIDFAGNTIFKKEELKYILGITPGEAYDQKKYNEGITERLQKEYYNQGYLFAQIQPKEVPVGKDTLDVTFNIVEGNVVSVKEINIVGNTKTHEKVIRREFK